MAALNKITIAGLFLVVVLLVGQLNQVESCRQKNADTARNKIQQLLADYPELQGEIFGASGGSTSTTLSTTSV